MKTIKVKIQPDGITAKEVNQVTNPTMGIRHTNYESMLRTFETEFFSKEGKVITPLAKIASESFWFQIDNPKYKSETIQSAEILENGKIRIL